MKVISSPNYEVDEAVHARLAEKYSSFMPEFAEFTVGPSKVRVDKRITEGLVQRTRQQTRLNPSVLCVKLLRICTRLGIPAVFVNIAVVLDDAVQEPLHIAFGHENDDLPWGYIFFPPAQLKFPPVHFTFILLHELCHCLLDIPDPRTPKEIYDYEFLADALSIATFREIASPHTQQYRETIKSLSYVAADEMKEKLGPKVQREILRDPQAFLRNMVHSTRTQPDGQRQVACSCTAE